MSREEDAYVIERMGKLLAEIAIIVNGTEPHDTLWSYHDLPEKVRALKQAPPAAVPAGCALVPVEPTDAMVGAGAYFVFTAVQTEATDSYKVAEAVWSAMLAAANE